MAENVRVVIRCRPMNSKETDLKCKNIVDIKDNTVTLTHPNDKQAPNKMFTYDYAYDKNAQTELLYNDICYSLIENVLEGYNGTIFAYGQTGCGKSHTMQGSLDSGCGGSSDGGIISKSFDHIFEAISVTNNIRYLAIVSYLEIYNENIRDLLKSITSTQTPTTPSTTIDYQLKELPGEGIIIQNLSTHTVHNAKECEELLKIGTKNRVCGTTLMNANSSRSHSIFSISLEQINYDNDDNNNSTTTTTTTIATTSTPTTTIRKGKLNLVDLAGSERQNKTGATGERFKEATKINLSLSALGNVISALVDGKTKHIPYRDSKLTRLLQDSLGGNTKTLMIACISPANYNYDETLSTLRYASRAKNIHNKPIINEDPKDTMLRQYQNEIIKLKNLLNSNANTNNEFHLNSINENLENEKIKLQKQYELEKLNLKNDHDIEKKEKEELVKDMERLKDHYENKLKELSPQSSISPTLQSKINNNNNNLIITNLNTKNLSSNVIQQEALNRIEMIKNALIGGERSNDIQLKEKRYKKKIAAENRLNSLALALSRIQETSDRDLLQEHYTDIQHEYQIKNDTIKFYKHKMKGLEREITDLQSEFQLDRADYLETIRRLERNLKFYQQIYDKTLPILRKDGKYWDPEEIKSESLWNDDLKKWKLPDDSMNRLKLPPAASAPSATSKRNGFDVNMNNVKGDDDDNEEFDSVDIAENYFRPRRTAACEMIQQTKDLTIKNMKNLQKIQNYQNNLVNSNWINLTTSTSPTPQITTAANTTSTTTISTINGNSLLASWLPQNHQPINKTWWGGLSPTISINSSRKINGNQQQQLMSSSFLNHHHHYHNSNE